ncbi:MAG: hypothetical protein SPE00_05860 [Bacilli bacterium]|nr:hypothetical protein [Bacilli bacterium]
MLEYNTFAVFEVEEDLKNSKSRTNIEDDRLYLYYEFKKYLANNGKKASKNSKERYHYIEMLKVSEDKEKNVIKKYLLMPVIVNENDIELYRKFILNHKFSNKNNEEHYIKPVFYIDAYSNHIALINLVTFSELKDGFSLENGRIKLDLSSLKEIAEEKNALLNITVFSKSDIDFDKESSRNTVINIREWKEDKELRKTQLDEENVLMVSVEHSYLIVGKAVKAGMKNGQALYEIVKEDFYYDIEEKNKDILLNLINGRKNGITIREELLTDMKINEELNVFPIEDNTVEIIKKSFRRRGLSIKEMIAIDMKREGII